MARTGPYPEPSALTVRQSCLMVALLDLRGPDLRAIRYEHSAAQTSALWCCAR